jgi:predicted AlkP superfamily pyrophosphatase or phosphodiesterase
MRRTRLVAALLVGLWLSASACDARALGPDARPTVLMISLDGTRPADLTAERLPALVAFARRGARAERLVPSFPTTTFPNHVTLVTGVAPERHGIVDNTFVDPERGLFEKKDIPTWLEVEPLWSLLGRAGIVSASFYWVGSEGAWPGGVAPRYWTPFSSQTPEPEKVAQILAWLDLPEPERPHFVTAWFHGADRASHLHGPDSPEAGRVLVEQNASLEVLFAGLDARALWDSTTVLVVSDHGMMMPERRVDLAAALERAGVEGARVIGIGGFASVRVEERRIARAVEAARAQGLEAWRREDAPASLRLANDRFGPVVVVAPRGTAIVHAGLSIRGFHGHRPEVPEMSALLVAAGRGVEPGTRLGDVSNLDVAPTILALLEVPVPEWMEGVAIQALLPGAGPSERDTAEEERP